MKIISVQEAMEVIKSTPTNDKSSYNRFNKKNFNLLMTALLNDQNFKQEVASYREGEVRLKEILPTKEFRKWCKRLLEKAGMDKKESAIVLKDDFLIDNVNGLYEFFAAAIYEYMDAGNRFDLLPKKDFKGSIYIKDVKKHTKKRKQYVPKDKTYLGEYEITKEDHKVLAAKSSCPSYLKHRKKV